MLTFFMIAYNRIYLILYDDRSVNLLVQLSSEESAALGLQEHICRLSLHMSRFTCLKV
jgi:hypothetical protein